MHLLAAPAPPSVPAGLLTVAVLAAVMLINTHWYIAHRSTIVASVRILSASLLLVHVYTDPGEGGAGGMLVCCALLCPAVTT